MVLAHTVETLEGSLAKPHKLELADIFRQFGDNYRRTHKMPLSHHKVMHAVKICRTSYLGGHMRKCSLCGYEHPTYNSCGNRHCPKCQSIARLHWVKRREEELLPVNYFHNVFTLPHRLNGLTRSNKKTIYDILFRSVSETLLEFGENELGGRVGFLAIFHTWDQKLCQHIHLHCIIPSGALTGDRKRWTGSPHADFLFSVRALSAVFRGKFLCYLKEAYVNGKLTFAGKSSQFESEDGFYSLINALYKEDWVVYSKRPFAGPERVIDSLGRYAFRIAISNDRIKCVRDGMVTFTYRDRKDDNIKKEITLSAGEFIRRFLTHVLPDSYTRIRHFGFLANRNRRDNISCVKSLLGVSPYDGKRKEQSAQEIMLELTGKDILKCPRCKAGTMTLHHLIPRFSVWVDSQLSKPELVDTS
ncbi:MAG: IS91 family transposase [Actinobacteria bacterium]|nr:IS91 family transposase [Actinomycetota bacterium]